VNSFFLQCFGLEEIDTLGKNIEDLSINVINSTLIRNIEYIFNGEKRSWSSIKRTESHVYEIKLYPLHTIIKGEDNKCVFEINDISIKDELEGKILQAEKLSSLSLLSAGVSHEINNPLSSIITNVQNLLVQENDQDKLISLNWIDQESKRIAKIVSELLDFSKSDLDEDQGVDVNVCINDIVKLLNYDLQSKGKINIFLNMQENLPPAMIGINELKQVIINLMQNSIYAIEGSGSITIKTNLSRNGKKIYIQIKDTGSGMDEEVMLHIFDPFYTTKINGDGTGLGLSILYGIISKYNGSIDAKSVKDKGTTMTIAIPILNGNKDFK
jgi:two-component system NtrC family sensor kinase